MLEHPGTELQLLIKEKGLTQKAFSSILGKKVSEVNELLKGKRNITIQRDYLLHQTLGTPIKYWILKQIDYDYSLIDIEESRDHDTILSDSEESRNDDTLSSGATAKDLKGEVEELNTQDSSSSLHSSLKGQTEPKETSTKESDSKDNEDLKNRAKIFRSF